MGLVGGGRNREGHQAGFLWTLRGWGQIVGITMTGRQIVLPYSEWRIANAFKPNVEMTAEDIVEMQRRVIAENKEWKRRKRKQENTGEVIDEAELERQRRYSRKRKKPSWGAPISAGAAIWD